jgi:hypothetical protein
MLHKYIIALLKIHLKCTTYNWDVDRHCAQHITTVTVVCGFYKLWYKLPCLLDSFVIGIHSLQVSLGRGSVHRKVKTYT